MPPKRARPNNATKTKKKKPRNMAYERGMKNGELLGALTREPRAEWVRRVIGKTKNNTTRSTRITDPRLRAKTKTANVKTAVRTAPRAKNTININTARVTDRLLRAEAAKRLARALGKSVTAMHARQGWAINRNGTRAIDPVSHNTVRRRDGVVLPDGRPRWFSRDTIAAWRASGRPMKGPTSRQNWNTNIKRLDKNARDRESAVDRFIRSAPFQRFLVTLSAQQRPEVPVRHVKALNDAEIKHTLIGIGRMYWNNSNDVVHGNRSAIVRLDYPVVGTFITFDELFYTADANVEVNQFDVFRILQLPPGQPHSGGKSGPLYTILKTSHKELHKEIVTGESQYFSNPRFISRNNLLGKNNNNFHNPIHPNNYASTLSDQLSMLSEHPYLDLRTSSVYQLIPAAKQMVRITRTSEFHRWRPAGVTGLTRKPKKTAASPRPAQTRVPRNNMKFWLDHARLLNRVK